MYSYYFCANDGDFAAGGTLQIGSNAVYGRGIPDLVDSSQVAVVLVHLWNWSCRLLDVVACYGAGDGQDGG